MSADSVIGSCSSSSSAMRIQLAPKSLETKTPLSAVLFGSAPVSVVGSATSITGRPPLKSTASCTSA